MAFLLFLLAILFATVVSVITALVEAFVLRFLLPHTGLAYDPTYGQAFVFCLMFNILVSWAISSSNATKND